MANVDIMVKAEICKVPVECQGAAKSQTYICYILRSAEIPARTYSGSTNHFTHRIRQHNGLIKGGARATRTNKPWLICALIYGFLTPKDARRYESFTKVKYSKNVYRSAMLLGKNSIQRRACMLLAAELQMTSEQRKNLKYFVPDAYMSKCLAEARAQGLPGTLEPFVVKCPVDTTTPSTKVDRGGPTTCGP